MIRDTAQWIADTGLVPVLRAQSTEEALALARAMYAGGVDIIEVTTTIPNAVEVVRQLKHEFGDAMLLGAGTVTTIPHCCDLIDAGAEFVVSPSLHPDVIAQTKARGQVDDLRSTHADRDHYGVASRCGYCERFFVLGNGWRELSSGH